MRCSERGGTRRVGLVSPGLPTTTGPLAVWKKKRTFKSVTNGLAMQPYRRQDRAHEPSSHPNCRTAAKKAGTGAGGPDSLGTTGTGAAQCFDCAWLRQPALRGRHWVPAGPAVGRRAGKVDSSRWVAFGKVAVLLALRSAEAAGSAAGFPPGTWGDPPLNPGRAALTVVTNQGARESDNARKGYSTMSRLYFVLLRRDTSHRGSRMRQPPPIPFLSRKERHRIPHMIRGITSWIADLRDLGRQLNNYRSLAPPGT